MSIRSCEPRRRPTTHCRQGAPSQDGDVYLEHSNGSELTPITSLQMAHSRNGCSRPWRILGLEAATRRACVFRGQLLALTVERTNDIGAARVLKEVGFVAYVYVTVKRGLPVYAQRTCRLEPQIMIGPLTDATGFALTIGAFADNKKIEATMLRATSTFKAPRQLPDVTAIACTGMTSETNQMSMQAAGLACMPGAGVPLVPRVVRERREHPGATIPDQLVLTPPWPATFRGKPPHGAPVQVAHDQRNRRTLHGVAKQAAAARLALDSKAAVKRNRWPAGTVATPTPPTGSTGLPTLLSTFTINCGVLRTPSQSPTATCRPARSLIACVNRSPLTGHRNQGLRRTPRRLKHTGVYPHRPPLARNEDQSWLRDLHYRRPTNRRSPRRNRQDPHPRCAPNKAKSGLNGNSMSRKITGRCFQSSVAPIGPIASMAVIGCGK